MSLVAFSVFALAPPRALAREHLVPGAAVLNDNGAWSWFEDERAVVDPVAGKLLVSSVADASGPGGAERSGDIDVAALNLATRAVDLFVLHDGLQDDDHNSAALYVRTDGRYVAMYGGHLADDLSRWRVSTAPGDPTAWAAEQALSNGASMTYSNLHYLPDDNGGAGRLYNFVRSIGFDPNILVSNDEGSTWAYGGRLLAEGGSGDRPYVRYASNGERIHFITTERHPRDFDNSVYHGYIQDGVLYNSAGQVVDANLFNPTAAAPDQLTQVFATGAQFGGETMRRAWTVDVAIDAAGAPVAVFQARAGDSDLDHRYFYGRWDGAQWQVSQMGYAGSYLYAAENDYTGLVSIDPNDPNTVYLSSEVHPATQAQLIGGDGQRHYELFRGRTEDGGANWQWTPLTFNSSQDNLRPVVPPWDDDNTAVIWMRGRYATYRDFDTRVVGVVNPDVDDTQLALAVDFGLNGQVVQPGFEAFTRTATPGGEVQTESYASAFAADGGQISVSLGGSLQFFDRGDDVAGPIGAVQEDFVEGAASLTLTLGNVAEGDYQLVLYGHDASAAGRDPYEIRLDNLELGVLRPSVGVSPAIGTASSRVALHSDGQSDITLTLAAPGGGDVVVNGLELWAGSAYASPPPVDLNGDGRLDFSDYLQYVDGLLADLTGLTSLEAYRRGDLNGDFRNDYADFQLFRQAYDEWNGAGALAAAIAPAPEPTTVTLAVLGAAVGAAGRRRTTPLGPLPATPPTSIGASDAAQVAAPRINPIAPVSGGEP